MHPLASADTRRLLLAGDTHASLASVRALVDAAVIESAAVIIQLGDFGYWTHTATGRTFLEGVDRELAAAGLLLVFIDGNHENHDLLRQNPADGTGFVPVATSVYWAPRGHRWVWEGTTFVSLGGASSLDRRLRTPGKSWWPEEALTEDDVAAATAAGPADVVLAHDAPPGVLDLAAMRAKAEASLSPPALKLLRRLASEEEIELVRRNRALLGSAIEVLRPAWLFHGHYHHRHDSVLALEDGGRVAVCGLDRDGTGERQWTVVETAGLSRRDLIPAG